MAIKIFSIKNKATGKIDRLVKAETKSQVNKHLAASVEIEPIGAVEIVNLMNHIGPGDLIVEDATSQATDEVTTPAAITAETTTEVAATDAPAAESNTGE